MKNIVAVITGDIVNSRLVEVSQWLPKLKETLNKYGSTPKTWEVYRGDSFQLRLPAVQGYIAALHLKATIKQYKNLDIRIAIGLGELSYTGQKVTESNGEAFQYSGDAFDNLNKRTLAIRGVDDSDVYAIQTMFDLAMLTANNWTVTVAQLIKMYIENPDKQQQEIAQLLNKSQSTVSETLSRSGYDEIIAVQTYYKQLIDQL